ncbi:MAG TPA: hypothetical protein VIK59_07180 [Verrucomicrobiae bacterium]
MKTNLTAAALLSAFCLLPSAFAQGVLTPPGPPAPTMKSLDQIEARIAITNTSTLAKISLPGSYYLTHNLTVTGGDAIHINTNGVTLDLNGFTISSTAPGAAGYAISLGNSVSDITIANGHIRGGVTNNGAGAYTGNGFAYGIYYTSGEPANVFVSHVSVSGCLYHGIFLNNATATTVEACAVQTVGSYGIFASTIKDSSALDCGSVAMDGEEVSNCHGQSSGDTGILANTAQNCYGESDGGGIGLEATTALNCEGLSATEEGLNATTAQNCYGVSGGAGFGIVASIVNNSYGFSETGYGVYASDIANASYGYSNGGTGLYAFIGNACSGTTENVTHKYNMP